MKIEEREHPAYTEWVKAGKTFRQPIGKVQYIYSSKNGKITLVLLLDYFMDGRDLWEFYCLKDTSSGIERFDTKEEAEKRIKELLE